MKESFRHFAKNKKAAEKLHLNGGGGEI